MNYLVAFRGAAMLWLVTGFGALVEAQEYRYATNLALELPDGGGLGSFVQHQVSGITGTITKVTVSLDISGSWSGDLYAYLNMGDAHTVLLNRVGKTATNLFGYGDHGFQVRFDDQAPNGDIHTYRATYSGLLPLSPSGALTGVWAPDGRVMDPDWVLDTDPRIATLSTFTGRNPNGMWMLFLADMVPGSVHKLEAWELTIRTGSMNQPPALTLSTNSVSYVSGPAAMVLDGNALVTDNDSLDFAGGALTAEFTEGFLDGDELLIRDQGPGETNITVTATNQVNYGATVIGAYSGGTNATTPLTIGFNASATPEIVQSVLRNITFRNHQPTAPAGKRTVRFELTDGDGGISEPATVEIRVMGVPAITWPTPASIVYGTPLGNTQLNATANVPGTFTFNPPAGTVLNAGLGQILSVTFTPLDTLNYHTATASVTLDVLQANTPPVLEKIADQVVVELNTMWVTNVANDADQPVDVLTFSLIEAPAGVEVNPASGVLSWTPTEAQGPGTNTVILQVRDNGQPSLNATQSFVVVVLETNTVPVLEGISTKEVLPGNTLFFTAHASDSDLPAQDLRFSLGAGAPYGATIGATSGIFKWRPTAVQGPSTNVISIIVTDNGLPPLSATQQVIVAVSANPPTNHAPTVLGEAAEVFKNGQLRLGKRKLLANDSDADKDPLTLSGFDPTSLQGGTIQDVMDSLLYTPATNFTGMDAFNYTVSDVHGAAANAMVTIRVKEDGDNSHQSVIEVVRQGNRVHITFTGIPGVKYGVECADSIVNANWVRCAELTAGTNGLFVLEEAYNPNIQRFYRSTWP